MPLYRIHRLKERRRQQFRWAPHTAGATQVRPGDYQEAGATEAPTPYAAWNGLLNDSERLGIGDLLEPSGGGLLICKYVGFELAEWLTPALAPEVPETG